MKLGERSKAPLEALGYYSNQEMKSAESQEQEMLLDQMLEHILTSEAAIKINEGNKGIILELDTTDLPEEVKDYFSQNLEEEEEEEDKLAVKIVKIYTGTEGRHEYDLQRQARKIIKEEKIAGVNVPKPRNFRALTITDDNIIEHLKSLGIKIGPEKKVEIIAMDFVPGKDVATLMYEEYVRHHAADFYVAYPELDLEEYLKQLNINDLINLVHRLAGIKTKYGNFDDSFAANLERHQIAKLISQDIAYRGLLEKGHADSLLQAVNIFHKHGLYHRDLHPRNIMIDRNGQVEIVDFGSAVKIDPSDKTARQAVYNAGPDRTHINDNDIFYVAKNLAKNDADRKMEAKQNFSESDFQSKCDKLAIQKPDIWQEFIDDIEKNKNIDHILSSYATALGEGYGYKDKVFLLQVIAGHQRQEEVKDYLRQKIKVEESKRKNWRDVSLLADYPSLLELLS